MPPFPEPLQQTDRTYVLHRGRRYIYFGGCDYFRLASHPKVLAAAESGLRQYGLNVSASRRTTGNHILYDQLEEALCDFFGIDAALLVSNGYATGQTAAQGLKGLFGRAYVDGRAHGCIADAATALACPVTSFDHSNGAALKRLISNRQTAKPALVLTDGAFAYDG
ncbi:MAG TPA: hypothetical protein VK968_06095, partial [Roseimicrobium sp.]|nr:hypothetical protein [Roseimicrobium sp.]